MAFKRTSEGRVFFKGADNDEISVQETIDSIPVKNDQTQVQILLLLKTLNTKLQDSQEERILLKQQLEKYKEEIKKLEERTSKHEQSYIELEQKVAQKQNETIKKASRVEESIKTTVKELENARKLVETLEGRSEESEEILKSLKLEISERRKQEDQLLKLQKALEKQQKDQIDKMADSVNSFVALTKRVNETEAKQASLDNKIEEATSEYLKLDRKIEKAIEDRSRILRKMERIEETVVQTRDALNAKAMVLLTSQGVVASDYAQISDHNAQEPVLQSNGPSLIPQRPDTIEDSALWWRKPIPMESSSIMMVLLIGLLGGWLISQIQAPKAFQGENDSEQIVKIEQSEESVEPTSTTLTQLAEQEQQSLPGNTDFYNQKAEGNNEADNNNAVKVVQIEELPPEEDSVTSNKIDIDESIAEPPATAATEDSINLNNETALAAAMDTNPDAVASKLNELEPSKLVPAEEISIIDEATKEKISPSELELRKRIQPDPNLSERAKKVEKQAFAGVAEAQHDMGAIYVAGQGSTKKDLARAAKWFEEAANNGVANAKYNLGVLYHQGMGVEKNLSKAIQLYTEAADLGHPEAQYNLGIANVEGIGVEYNPQKAAKYFESAAKKDVIEAAYNLGLIYENGLLGQAKPDEALMWYKAAADKGSPEAKAALEQLAKSLNVELGDVNRVVDDMRAKKDITPTESQSATGEPEKLSLNEREKAQQVNDSKRDDVIAQIQEELMHKGLYPGPVDGKIGPLTSDAIRTYQSKENMEVVDGIPSSQLLNHMKGMPSNLH